MKLISNLNLLCRFKLACSAAVIGLLSMSPGAHAQEYCQGATGTHNNYFFTHYTNSQGTGCINLLPGGQYSYRWNGWVWDGSRWNMSYNNVVGGKGWNPGSSSRVINYNAGYYQSWGNSVLGVYGWTQYPLVEYYVVDSWFGWRPPEGPTPGRGGRMGTVVSDGGVYDLYIVHKSGASIEGYKHFTQYWSVRQSPRALGQNNRITFQNHVNAWAAQGWNLGQHSYQVLGTEGYHSNGGVNVTVW